MWTTFLLRANELAAERSREAKRERHARELRRHAASQSRRSADPPHRARRADALTDRLWRHHPRQTDTKPDRRPDDGPDSPPGPSFHVSAPVA